jgi:hypothetical protein
MGILAVALAYTEACIVVYLRQAIAPLRSVHFPAAASEPLPLLTLQQLREGGDVYPRLLVTEIAREITPLVVLLAAGWALARRKGQLAAFFLFGFGVWDIFYYVFLKILLGWPASLGTWDVLYLISTAWVAPVWAPLTVAATLVLAGASALYRGERRSGRLAFLAWSAIAAGTALVLTSFFLRTGEAFGSVPSKFDWPIFLCGWAMGVAGIVLLLRRSSRA